MSDAFSLDDFDRDLLDAATDCAYLISEAMELAANYFGDSVHGEVRLRRSLLQLFEFGLIRVLEFDYSCLPARKIDMDIDKMKEVLLAEHTWSECGESAIQHGFLTTPAGEAVLYGPYD